MENFIFCPVLDSLSSKYDNYILMGDFNAKISNNFVDIFCGFDSLKSLIKKSKWFKDPDNPTCIALILTNRQKSLQILQIYKQDILTSTSLLLLY